MKIETWGDLGREADRSAMREPGARPAWELRDLIAEAFGREFPGAMVAARRAAGVGGGKKAIVAAAVAAMVDLEDPLTAEALETVARAGSWRAAIVGVRALGAAGQVLAFPVRRGLSLPCAPCACPGDWGTNFGLPNVQAVAERVLRMIPAQPRRGNGWALLPAV